MDENGVLFGKRQQKKHGTSPCFMGKSTLDGLFSGSQTVSLPEATPGYPHLSKA